MSRSGDDPMPETAHVTPRTTPAARPATGKPVAQPIFDVRDVSVHYGAHRAVRDVSLRIHQNEITALIGPSGCGKSTFIRCLNRMNDLIPTARVDGEVVYHDENLYAPDID